MGNPANSRETVAFLREGQTTDLYAASAHQFINQPNLPAQPGIDAAGYTQTATENTARAYGIQTQSVDNRYSVDASGLTMTDERPFTRTASLL